VTPGSSIALLLGAAAAATDVQTAWDAASGWAWAISLQGNVSKVRSFKVEPGHFP
jgi:hypothetical protein